MLDGPDEWRCEHGWGHPSPARQAAGERWPHACDLCAPGDRCPGSIVDVPPGRWVVTTEHGTRVVLDTTDEERGSWWCRLPAEHGDGSVSHSAGDLRRQRLLMLMVGGDEWDISASLIVGERLRLHTGLSEYWITSRVQTVRPATADLLIRLDEAIARASELREGPGGLRDRDLVALAGTVRRSILLRGFAHKVVATVTGPGRWQVSGDVDDMFILAGRLRRGCPLDPDVEGSGHNIGLGYSTEHMAVEIRVDDAADVDHLRAVLQEGDEE